MKTECLAPASLLGLERGGFLLAEIFDFEKPV